MLSRPLGVATRVRQLKSEGSLMILLAFDAELKLPSHNPPAPQETQNVHSAALQIISQRNGTRREAGRC